MPQRPDLARPVMGRSTSLHPDAAGRRLGEESKHLTSAQLARHRRRTLALDCMHLEKVLRQVDPNPDKGSHGRLPSPRPATGHALALDAVRVRPSTSSLRALRQRPPRRQHRKSPRVARRRPASRRFATAAGYHPGGAARAPLPMPALRRPHDRHRGLRPRMRAEAAADPKHDSTHHDPHRPPRAAAFPSLCAGSRLAAISLDPQPRRSMRPIARSYPPRHHRADTLFRSLARSRGQAVAGRLASAVAAHRRNRPSQSNRHSAAPPNRPQPSRDFVPRRFLDAGRLCMRKASVLPASKNLYNRRRQAATTAPPAPRAAPGACRPSGGAAGRQAAP